MRVGFASEIYAVFFPPMVVVLPAKLLMMTIKTNAIMLTHLVRPEFSDAIILPDSLLLLEIYKTIYLSDYELAILCSLVAYEERLMRQL